MRKKLIVYLLLMLLPIVASAQGVGGQVKRPVKKQQTTNTTLAKKKQTLKKENQPVEQKPSREVIIQRLIENMVFVEGGTFTMGATSEQGSYTYANEKPTHQVTVSSFSIGKYEVTQEEWEAVMGSNLSPFKGAKRPVQKVSWNDCQEFIRKLNAMTGKQFRLPTEAEWEFAARGGNKSRGYMYAGSDNINRIAWCGNNCRATHEVGQKSPNELGLYDMSGNVWEWCQDGYASYSSNSQTNPTGDLLGTSRVIRGGSYLYYPGICRVSIRNDWEPDTSNSDFGLRLAL